MADTGVRLNVSDDIAAFMRRIDAHEQRHVPFVTAYALTKTAQDIKAAEIDVMAKVFDRPTRFTLNALYVKPATKANLTAVVEFKERFGSVPAWRYLGPQVVGGTRRHKSHETALISAGVMKTSEFAVPGVGAELDANGNMKVGHLTRILSQLPASRDSTSNMTARSRKRAIKSAGGRFFLLRGSKSAPDGIYRREGGRYPIVPVLIFVSSVGYAKRFPFYATAREVMQRNFARNFREGWQRYVVNDARAAA